MFDIDRLNTKLNNAMHSIFKLKEGAPLTSTDNYLHELSKNEKKLSKLFFLIDLKYMQHLIRKHEEELDLDERTKNSLSLNEFIFFKTEDRALVSLSVKMVHFCLALFGESSRDHELAQMIDDVKKKKTIFGIRFNMNVMSVLDDGDGKTQKNLLAFQRTSEFRILRKTFDQFYKTITFLSDPIIATSAKMYFDEFDRAYRKDDATISNSLKLAVYSYKFIELHLLTLLVIYTNIYFIVNRRIFNKSLPTVANIFVPEKYLNYIAPKFDIIYSTYTRLFMKQHVAKNIILKNKNSKVATESYLAEKHNIKEGAIVGGFIAAGIAIVGVVLLILFLRHLIYGIGYIFVKIRNIFKSTAIDLYTNVDILEKQLAKTTDEKEKKKLTKIIEKQHTWYKRFYKLSGEYIEDLDNMASKVSIKEKIRHKKIEEDVETAVNDNQDNDDNFGELIL